MKGSYEVIVKNRRLQYKFTISRNITILRGDSATGKTTLIDMIQLFQEEGIESGVTVSCRCPCLVLTSSNWQLNLSAIQNSIVFIDEGHKFISTPEFARTIRESTNYYVFATRNSLFNLPYSITEIYGIKNTSANKYQGTRRLYSSFYPLYSSEIKIKPQLIIVEDSNAGYDFFSAVSQRFSIPCISAKGKSNIHTLVKNTDKDNILIIADGAAFGAEIERIAALSHIKNIGIYMPESFEWILLKANLLKDSNVEEILEHTPDFIESSEYFSWEQFFTALLSDKTKGTYLEYKKTRLNKNYLQENEMSKVISAMPGML